MVKNIISYILSFIMVALIIAIVAVSFLQTKVLNEDYWKMQMEQNNYYEKLEVTINDGFENYIMQSGMDSSVFEGIYDLDKKTLREKKVSDIKNRVKIANSSNADIFVSIHLNKIPQDQYWGWQTFFKKNDEKSKKLANSLQQGLNQTIQKENKREPLKIENVYIIEHNEIPTSIVECGFLSNPEENKLLQQEEYQDKLAWGIYIGIMDYFLE